MRIPGSIRGLTSCQGKNGTRASRLSASFQLQPASEDLRPVKARMAQGHQDCQLRSNSSQHDRTYKLSRQEWHKGIKTVSFIPTPASIRGLTLCQGKNGTRASRLSASFQLQPASEDCPPVKARMAQGHQDCQLCSHSSQHHRTYVLSRQEWHKGIKIVRFIPTPASITGLTPCQAKNGTRASRLSASFQLQPGSEDLPPVKARMAQGHQNCQVHSNTSQHHRSYPLSSQEWHKGIKTVSFIPTPARIRGL